MSGHGGCPWGWFPEPGRGRPPAEDGRPRDRPRDDPGRRTREALRRAHGAPRRQARRRPGRAACRHGAERVGKTTLLRVLVGLAAEPRGTVDVSVDRSRIGYVGHDSHLYADLARSRTSSSTAGSIASRSGASGSGCSSSGSDSGSTQSRGRVVLAGNDAAPRSAALLHEPELLVLGEPYSALDTDGALLDDELAPSGRTRAIVVATRPERLAPLVTATCARSLMSEYLADVVKG